MEFDKKEYKCDWSSRYSSSYGRLYALNCDSLRAGCAESGNTCWIPDEEKDEQELRLIERRHRSDVEYFYYVNVHYVCDCTLVGCEEFKDITTKKLTGIVFPLGKVNLDTCKFSKRSLLITSEDTSSFMENKSEANDQKTEISLDNLSGGSYQWKIRYEMTNGHSFESPPRALTVIASPKRTLIEGLSPIDSTIWDETVQYLTEPNALISLPAPSGPSSFHITGQLDCDSGAFTCDHTKSCTLPLFSSSISCSYLQMISNGEDVSISSNSAHLIHFVTFGVDFASRTGNQYSVKVRTHTGDYNDSLIIEKAVLSSDSSCTFYSGKQETPIPLNRILEFTCSDESTPKIQLVLSFATQIGSVVTSKEFRSDFLKMPTIPTISNLKITASENEIVTASWNFIFPPSLTCSFAVSVSVSGSSSQTTAKANIEEPSIVLNSMTSSHGTLSISHDDEVAVSVTPQCNGFAGDSISLIETVCVPLRPVIGDFVCSSCLPLNGFLVSHKLTLSYSFVVSSPGRSCKDSSLPFLYFSFNDAYVSGDYLETIEVSLPFAISDDLSEQTQTPIVSQRLLLNGFVFSTNFSYCIVSLPNGAPTIDGATFSYLTFTGVDLNHNIVFFGVRDLYSPCFSHGYYEIEYWTYSDRTHLTYSLKAETKKADTSETLHSIIFTISAPEIYYFQIVALNALNESVKSDTYLISVCIDIADLPKPSLSSPGSSAVEVSVLNPQFIWDLASEIRMIRCDSSETALLIFELTETAGLLESETYSISYSVSLFTTKLVLDSSDLLKLSTNYSWRLSVFHQKPTKEPRIVRSDVSTFTTVSKHCAYLDCNNGICDDSSVKCVCHSGYHGDLCDNYGLPIGAYFGIVAGSILFVGIGVFLIIQYLIRSNVFGVRLPDFSHFMFSMPKLISDDDTVPTDLDLIKMNVNSDSTDFSWALSLLECTSSTESDNICRALVYAYERNGRALQLIRRLIEFEIATAHDASTLFRNNSFSTKCFKVYGRMVGLPYLFRVLHPLLDKLVKDEQRNEAGVNIKGNKKVVENMLVAPSVSYELNPELHKEEGHSVDDGSLETNNFAVQLACQRFLSSLDKTRSFCPLEFRILCNSIEECCLERFPESTKNAISAFLFLRFFVAGLSVPESFGVLPDAPSDSLRRQLILISKVLQNLSTNVKFGDKEDYMIVMNEFLGQNEDALNSYYQFLCSGTSSSFTPVVIPDKYYDVSIEVLSMKAPQIGKDSLEDLSKCEKDPLEIDIN